GGSLRLFAVPGSAEPDESVREILAEEKRLGVDRAEYFRGFAGRVEQIRQRLTDLLTHLKSRGHRIAAYGASAKGSVLLNAVGIGLETLDFVADVSPQKQGRYMPGVHVPIVS